MADWPSAQAGGQVFTQMEQSATANASAGTKGSWAELHASTPFDASGVYLSIANTNNVNRHFVDIGIGASTAEVIIIADYFMDAPRANQSTASAYFPITIPRGSRLAIRTSSSPTGSGIARAQAILVSGGFISDPGMSRVTTYGITTPGAGGTGLDPGGVADTKGSWSQLSASVNRTRALLFAVNLGVNTAANTFSWRLDIGIGSGPTVLIPEVPLRSNVTSDDVGQKMFGPFPVDIPAGTSLHARCECSGTDATDRLLAIVAYGVD